jgi:hypothetical protein
MDAWRGLTWYPSRLFRPPCKAFSKRGFHGFLNVGGQSYAISHYKLSFWAAASAQRALAAAVRARPPVGRARPSLLPIKKALASKWLLNEERCFGGGQPAGLAAAPSIGPPPAKGGRRPHKIPPTRIQKLFASNWYKPPLALEKMLYLCDARLAQRLEHLAVNQRVAGSNPAAGASSSASSHKHLH